MDQGSAAAPASSNFLPALPAVWWLASTSSSQIRSTPVALSVLGVATHTDEATALPEVSNLELTAQRAVLPLAVNCRPAPAV